MFLKNFNLLFLMFLILGTMMALSANSWMTCWLGLEINLMSLIPLMLKDSSFQSTESAIKYFIPQAMASLLLISASMMETLTSSIELSSLPNLLVSMSMLIKLGVAPFHFWFPQVVNHLEWPLCILLLMWQKIAPFMILMSFSYFNLIMVTMVASSIVGATGGLNQTNLKLLLAFSSIAHSSWLMGTLISSSKIWAGYFMMYSMITIPIILTFNKSNMKKIPEIFSLKSSESMKQLMIFNIMSLGGLPPFLGFSAKLYAILSMMDNIPLFVLLTMIMSSLIALFYYLKLFFNSTLIKSINKMTTLQTPNHQMSNLIIMASTMNLAAPLVIFMT